MTPPTSPKGLNALVLPMLTTEPLFAAHHIDAARVTELLFWILAFTAYVVLGLVILIRIGRSIKEGKSGGFGSGSQTEMFRDLYRKKLISPEEYNKIQTEIRDRLVGNVMGRTGVAEEGTSAAKDGAVFYEVPPVITAGREAARLEETGYEISYSENPEAEYPGGANRETGQSRTGTREQKTKPTLQVPPVIPYSNRDR